MNELLQKVEVSLFKPNGLTLTHGMLESESQDYGACRFQINRLKVVSRNARITPNKIGQFVTLWKRSPGGPIMPLEESDAIDLIIINVQYMNRLGQFVFPKSILCEKGILSKSNKEGKRGFRVYPSWDIPQNKQALKTQNWQLEYFLAISKTVDLQKLKKLYQTP